jgi:hypothetical protein
VNCEQAREQLDAEPTRRPPELAEHLAGCAPCSAHAARVAAFESRLHRALSVPVPPAPAASVTDLASRRPPAGRMRPWFALAAGGALAAIAVALALTVYPRQALARAVVGHVEGEPGSWATTETVADTELDGVLRRSGVRLDPGGPRVTYAQSCRFRGWRVPHLIVQTSAGPMTVMLLAHEHVSAAVKIDEDGYRGVIMPAGRGAVAVLARGAGDPEVPGAVAAEAAQAIHFTD